MRRTIAMEWEDFERKVLDPARASLIQRRESKRCFYAGCQTVLFLLVSQLGPESEPTEADMRYVDSLKIELDTFSEQVKLGNA